MTFSNERRPGKSNEKTGPVRGRFAGLRAVETGTLTIGMLRRHIKAKLNQAGTAREGQAASGPGAGA